MASSPLQNYLKANRKRLALSQDDVAYLLGGEKGGTVCRHERFAQEPGLRTALAYEATFGRPVRELFAGLYKKIQKEVATRATGLSRRPPGNISSRQASRKRQTLADIAGRESDKPQNQA